VHPLLQAYSEFATAIKDEALLEDARYTNPPKSESETPAKCPKMNLAESGKGWVEGCSAACPTVRLSLVG
jgi:hypothetical protein